MMCFTFQEFLKKEFSHENIYFWTACERYRKIKGDDEDSVKVRMAAAENIIKRHLSSGAPEPVNVDSHARQAAQEGPPTSHLFATAQKQIYNLMKFDSFRYVYLCTSIALYRIIVVLLHTMTNVSYKTRKKSLFWRDNVHCLPQRLKINVFKKKFRCKIARF